MQRFIPATLTLLILIGCGEAPETEVLPPPTTSPNAAVLEVGKGATAFEALAEDESLIIVVAPQSGNGLGFGQHFDIALRAKNVDATQLTVHVVLTTEDGVASDVTQKINLAKNGDWWIGAGIRAVVDACFELVDKAVTITIDIEDRTGKKATATKRVSGPEACPREAG